MTEKTYREALTDALFLEMRRDENVFVMGEDVAVSYTHLTLPTNREV